MNTQDIALNLAVKALAVAGLVEQVRGAGLVVGEDRLDNRLHVPAYAGPVVGEDLRDALSKLRMNDGSFVYEPDTSEALGFGFRVERVEKLPRLIGAVWNR